MAFSNRKGAHGSQESGQALVSWRESPKLSCWIIPLFPDSAVIPEIYCSKVCELLLPLKYRTSAFLLNTVTIWDIFDATYQKVLQIFCCNPREIKHIVHNVTFENIKMPKNKLDLVVYLAESGTYIIPNVSNNLIFFEVRQ